MITAAELADAEHLNCDLTTVYRMAQTGRIPFIRVGGEHGEYRFVYEDVLAALRPPERVDPWINPRARRRSSDWR